MVTPGPGHDGRFPVGSICNFQKGYEDLRRVPQGGIGIQGACENSPEIRRKFPEAPGNGHPSVPLESLAIRVSHTQGTQGSLPASYSPYLPRVIFFPA